MPIDPFSLHPAYRFASPVQPASGLDDAALASRVRVHRFGDEAREPDASVLTIHHYTVKEWWNQFYSSVSDQVRSDAMGSWELVEVQNFDNALSLGEAWNLAAKMARGRYVVMIGDDDWLQIDALGRLVAEMSRAGDGVYCLLFRMIMVDLYGTPIRDCGGSFFMNREWFLSTGGFEAMTLMEDEEWLWRVRNNQPGAIVETACQAAFYRVRRGQASSAIKMSLYEELGGAGFVV
jgi:hypothetical protein